MAFKNFSTLFLYAFSRLNQLSFIGSKMELMLLQLTDQFFDLSSMDIFCTAICLSLARPERIASINASKS